MLDLAEVIALGALQREESRGAHSRRDFPERDDADLDEAHARLPDARRAAAGVRPGDHDALAAGEEGLLVEAKLRVRRYDPSARRRARSYQSYTIEMPQSATVLDTPARRRGSDVDGSLAFRCACRSAICGSCAMRINGESRLACKTKVIEVVAARPGGHAGAAGQPAGDQGPGRGHGAVLRQDSRHRPLAGRRPGEATARARVPGRRRPLDEALAVRGLHPVRRLLLGLSDRSPSTTATWGRRPWPRPIRFCHDPRDDGKARAAVAGSAGAGSVALPHDLQLPRSGARRASTRRRRSRTSRRWPC